MFKKIKSKNEFADAFTLCAVILLYFYWSTNVTLFYYLTSFILILIFIISDENKAFTLLFFLLPFENMLRISDQFQSIVTYLIAINLFKLLIRRRFKVPKVSVIISIVFLVNLLLGGILFLRIFPSKNIRFITNSIYIIMLIYDKKFINAKNGITCSEYFINGCIIFLFMSVVYSIDVQGIDILKQRLYGIQEDPNYIAINFSVSLSLLLIIFNRSEIKFKYFITKSITLLIGILLTQSRGAIVSLIPYILFLVISLMKQNKGRLALLVGSTFIYLAIFKIDLDNSFIENVSSRFGRISTDGGSSRVQIWLYYIDIFSTNLGQLLFGLDNFKHTGFFPSAHSMILGGIASSGLINMFVMLYFYYYAKLNIVKEKISLQYVVPILTMFFGYFFLDALLINVFFYIVILCFLLTNTERSENYER